MSFPACTAPCRASSCFSIASINPGVSNFAWFPAWGFGFPRSTCATTTAWTSSPASLCPPSRYGSSKTANRKESLMKYLLKFEEPCAAKIERSGGKGANLALLTQGGFPVPAGFIVTAQAYRDFIGTSGGLIGCACQLPSDEAAPSPHPSPPVRERLVLQKRDRSSGRFMVQIHA